MLVALPAAIAYGMAVYGALGPAYVATGVRAGILGAVVLGFVAAAFGGSPRLISSPSAPAAAVLASIVVSFTTDKALAPDRVLGLLALITLGAGLLQTFYGAIGGGRLIKYIPYPVVAGYLSAVAVMIFLGQVPKFLGLDSSVTLIRGCLEPALWRWPAVVVGSVTVAAMIAAPRVTKKIPATILGVLAGIVAYFALSLLRPELRHLGGNPLLLGQISFEGPDHDAGTGGAIRAFGSLGLYDLQLAIVPALTLSILLSIDSLKTCVIVDALTFSRHDSNRTLVGQGAGNALAGMFGAMPGSGTMGATLVNVESGGQTRRSGIIAAVALGIIVLLFERWIAWIPVAALAGVLLVVAARMFDWNSLYLVRQRSTRLDFAAIAIVVAVAVTTNLIAAAGAGVALAVAWFVRDQVRGSVIHRKTLGTQLASKQHRLPAEQATLEHLGKQIVVCELQGSLFFGTTDQLFRELEPELKTCRYVILDLRRVQSVDYTATHLFDQFQSILRSHGGWLLFSRLPPRRELQNYIQAHRDADRERNTRTFVTLDDALQWAEDDILKHHLPAVANPSHPLGLAEFELTSELLNDPGLGALTACAMARSFHAGETLFHAGDRADDLYLVRRGIVRVTLPIPGNGYHTLATFGRGSFFGELAFLVRGPRSADAIATADTDVFVISRAKFDEVAKANPNLGLKIFSGLARALAVSLRRADADLRAFYET